MTDSIAVGTFPGGSEEEGPGQLRLAWTPSVVFVGLTEAQRDWEDAALPVDREVLLAANALARGLGCPCESIHVTPDADGVTRPEVGIARTVADARSTGGGGTPILVAGSRSVLRMGTTVRGLLVDPPCPLWIQRGPWSGLTRVVAAVESLPQDRSLVGIAAALARSLGAELDLLHYPGRMRSDSGTDSRPGWEQEQHAKIDPASGSSALEGLELEDARLVLAAGASRTALLAHIVRADVAVLGRGHRSGLGRILDETARSRTGPFVIVPPQRQSPHDSANRRR